MFGSKRFSLRSAGVTLGLLGAAVTFPGLAIDQTEIPAPSARVSMPTAPEAPVPVSQAEAAPAPRLTLEQMDQMVGPIALYPDPLLAQVFAAATYPLEIVRAARWVRQHPDGQGVDDQDWDPSVRAVAHYPSVIQMLDDNLDWTIQLGQTFLNQSKDLMNSVQQLRAKAQALGNLKSSAQEDVVQNQQAIQIAPAQPDVMYVPVYDPQVIYYEPATVYGGYPLITYGPGYPCGWWLDLDCDWYTGFVWYHNWYGWRHYGERYGQFGREHWESGHHPDLTRPGREGDVWRHDPRRERPVTVRPGFARTGLAAAPRPTRTGEPLIRAGSATRTAVPPSSAAFGYQRGTQAQLYSARGQYSRSAAQAVGAVHYAAPAPRAGPVYSAPAPAARAGAGMLAAPYRASAPAQSSAFNGYRSGSAATAHSERGNSSRGQASHGGGGGGGRGGGGKR